MFKIYHVKKVYIASFTSSYVVTIASRLVEFDKNKDLLINFESQVDKVHNSKDSKYDMIIGSDIMNNLNIDLLFSA